jgi:hypothetical protein
MEKFTAHDRAALRRNDAMSRLAAVVVGCLALFGTEASAQQRWTSPDSNFSVIIPAGWDVEHSTDEASGEDRQLWLRISSQSGSGRNECVVWKWNHQAGEVVAQNDVNRMVGAQTRESWNPEGILATEFSNDIRDGVAFMRIVGESTRGAGVPTSTRFGVFLIAYDENITEYTIGCDLTQPADAQHQAASAGFFDSLSFNARTSP